MATGTEGSDSAQNFVDWLKWIFVLALLGGGVFGNWYYQDESLLIRAVALVAAGLVAGFVALQTERGQRVWNLARQARTELRRVVWPTRQEATQTTLIVLILILLFSLILWGLDSLLSFLVQMVLG